MLSAKLTIRETHGPRLGAQAHNLKKSWTEMWSAGSGSKMRTLTDGLSRSQGHGLRFRVNAHNLLVSWSKMQKSKLWITRAEMLAQAQSLLRSEMQKHNLMVYGVEHKLRDWDARHKLIVRAVRHKLRV